MKTKISIIMLIAGFTGTIYFGYTSEHMEQVISFIILVISIFTFSIYSEEEGRF